MTLKDGTIRLAGARIGHIYNAYMSICGRLSAHDDLSAHTTATILTKGMSKLLHDIRIFTIFAYPTLKWRVGPKGAAQKLAAWVQRQTAVGGITFGQLSHPLLDVKLYPNVFPLMENLVQNTCQMRDTISED